MPGFYFAINFWFLTHIYPDEFDNIFSSTYQSTRCVVQVIICCSTFQRPSPLTVDISMMVAACILDGIWAKHLRSAIRKHKKFIGNYRRSQFPITMMTKHRKNCECCPVSLLIVRSQRLSSIQVCQKKINNISNVTNLLGYHFHWNCKTIKNCKQIKIVKKKVVKNCQNCQKLSNLSKNVKIVKKKVVKNCQNCQKLSNLSKNVKIVKKIVKLSKNV